MDNWTLEEMADQHGKIAVVTGGNSGIGYETAKALAQAGAHVLITARSEQKGEMAAQAIRQAIPAADVEVGILDLAKLAAVAAFAQRLIERGQPLDLLINNAGVMAVPERRLTADGFEMHMGTNHFGHYALTGRLWPLLLKAESPRIVTVSSGVSRWPEALIDFDDMLYEHGYTPMGAYARSKLANLLFALELNRRAPAGNMISVAVHPGTTFTNLQQHMLPAFLNPLARPIFNSVIGQSVPQSALPSLYAATAPGVSGDTFYGPTGRSEMRGAPGKVAFPERALDKEVACRLWELSAEGTHVDFV